jgi:hypothetical protein
MSMVTLKDSHLTYNGVAYFRGNSEETELGSIGEKHTSLIKMNVKHSAKERRLS